VSPETRQGKFRFLLKIGRQRIAFVDYKDLDSASFAQSSCQGYRFMGANRGLNVRISDNNRRSFQKIDVKTESPQQNSLK
jgi:hypothetical protein